MPISFTRDRLTELLRGAREKRIVVIGDAMLDAYLTGDVERISPEAPVPVVRIRERRFALGGAANVANNVRAIGCRCTLVATTGRDAWGSQLRSMLDAIGAPLDGLLEVSRPTTTKTRVVARSQQLLRVDEEEDADLSETEVAALAPLVDAAVRTADALIFEDYNKGVLVPDVIRLGMRVARDRGIPVIVDPKFRHFFQYAGATVFKPNRRELETALGARVDRDVAETGAAALDQLGVDHLLLTLGDRGMFLLSRGTTGMRIPGVARQVYDVVGAGDTVTAYLSAILAAGGTVREASEIANLAAGIEVGKLGAATVTPEELLEDLASR